MGMTRRQFVSAAACVATLSLVGCSGSHLASGGAPIWEATRDDSLPELGDTGSDAAIVMPVQAWAPRDGYIQLQLVGASLPRPSIQSVSEDGDGTLTVTLEKGDGPQTMDLEMSEWRLEVHEGSVESVRRVVADGEEASRVE